MKRPVCALALAALLFAAVCAAPSPAAPTGSAVVQGAFFFPGAQAQGGSNWASSSGTGSDVGQDMGQNMDNDGTGLSRTSGLRSFLPLLLMVGLYLLIRRTFRPKGGPRSGFGSGFGPKENGQNGEKNGRAGKVVPMPPPRDASHPNDPGDPEDLKDAYANARRAWDAFTAEPGRDVPAGEPRPAGYEPRSEAGEPEVLDVEAEAVTPDKPDDAPEAAPEAAPKADGAEAAPESAPESVPDSAPIPADDFDEEDFLRGARLVFERLVEAMDGLDPEQAANFANAPVVNEIKHRLNQGHPPAESEVLRVEAKIMQRTAQTGQDVIRVYYDALKKVSGLGSVSVRQIWTFTKDNNDPAAMWMLESVEPVEA